MNEENKKIFVDNEKMNYFIGTDSFGNRVIKQKPELAKEEEWGQISGDFGNEPKKEDPGIIMHTPEKDLDIPSGWTRSEDAIVPKPPKMDEDKVESKLDHTIRTGRRGAAYLAGTNPVVNQEPTMYKTEKVEMHNGGVLYRQIPINPVNEVFENGSPKTVPDSGQPLEEAPYEIRRVVLNDGTIVKTMSNGTYQTEAPVLTSSNTLSIQLGSANLLYTDSNGIVSTGSQIDLGSGEISKSDVQQYLQDQIPENKAKPSPYEYKTYEQIKQPSNFKPMAYEQIRPVKLSKSEDFEKTLEKSLKNASQARQKADKAHSDKIQKILDITKKAKNFPVKEVPEAKIIIDPNEELIINIEELADELVMGVIKNKDDSKEYEDLLEKYKKIILKHERKRKV